MDAIQLSLIESEIERQHPTVQEFYRDMVRKGESPRFAAMCAMRSAPLTRYSDKTFNKQRRQIMGNMKPKQRDAYLKMAKQAGISTQGKYYVGGLGRPSDPTAWVSTVDEVKDVCRAKNLTAEGLVKCDGYSVEGKPRVAMAEDVQMRFAREYMAKDPRLAAACKADPARLAKLKAEVVDRHAKPCK
jgi:hypothetical protein